MSAAAAAASDIVQAELAGVLPMRREDGAALLDEVETFLSRFVAFPSEHTRVAVALWAAHAHALPCFESTPRLAVLSPEPGSGKTRLQEILALLVPRPMFTTNLSAAALFRKVGTLLPPTILLDEADTIFGPRASKDHEDLRALVNAGHRRGAVTSRCVVKGKNIEVEDFPSYAAVSLSGLDDLPDTIMSRSIVVRMRRRAPGEWIEPYRHRVHSPAGHALRDRLTRWVLMSLNALEVIPDMPGGVEDRPADVWEALLAVADAARGTWPDRARVAAVALVADSRGSAESLGVRLLGDLRTVFGSADAMSTEDILTALHALDEAPWADLRGKPLDARGLARRLGRYEVKSKVVRVGDSTPRGYTREDLWDAWGRYLPTTSRTYPLGVSREGEEDAEPQLSLLPEESATSATSATVEAS